jgi:mannitol-1-phosphate/altronate dehydrogenase
MALPAGVSAPHYDLAAVTPGIVHIGLGGFHRAHFARYTHDLMQEEPEALAWGIIGSGLRASDAPLLGALKRQDGLYTLVERDAANETRSVIGAIVGTIDASESSATLLKTIARPATRIVSVTVSEHGYHLNGSAKTLDLDCAAIRDDLAAPRTPRTLPGILVEAYRRRREAGETAFTVLSCDNIPHNGAVLRAAILAFAEASYPDLAVWIEDHGCFPNSMVDRITPIPTGEEIANFAAESGIDDAATVFTESFRQWVIEDNFAAGRPNWDRVGAQFVADVTPYETMKLRLLNASHLAIAGLGTLSGYETIGEAIADPLIRRYMIRLMDNETGPTLSPVPGIDLAGYKATLIERFANPAVRDTARRVNSDAPVNLLLDPLRDRLAAGASIDLLSLGLAAWFRRLRSEAGRDAQNHLKDATQILLHARARSGGDDPTSILSVETIFGELVKSTHLVSAIRTWLESFTRHGVVGTLAAAGKQGLF